MASNADSQQFLGIEPEARLDRLAVQRVKQPKCIEFCLNFSLQIRENLMNQLNPKR